MSLTQVPPTMQTFYTGQVLQTLITQDSGSTTSSTALTNMSAGNQGIIPKSTNSKILIRCTFQAYIPPASGANVLGYFQLRDTTNATYIGSGCAFAPYSGGGNVGGYSQQTVEYWVTNSALTLRQFALSGYTGNASYPFTAQYAIWTLTEIAG